MFRAAGSRVPPIENPYVHTPGHLKPSQEPPAQLGEDPFCCSRSCPFPPLVPVSELLEISLASQSFDATTTINSSDTGTNGRNGHQRDSAWSPRDRVADRPSVEDPDVHTPGNLTTIIQKPPIQLGEDPKFLVAVPSGGSTRIAHTNPRRP